MPYYKEDPYEYIREIVPEAYEDATSKNLEAVVGQAFKRISPEELEIFLRDTNLFFRKALGFFKKALPGATPPESEDAVTELTYIASEQPLVYENKKTSQNKINSAPLKHEQKICQNKPSGLEIKNGHNRLGMTYSPAAMQLLQTIFQPKVIQGLVSMAMRGGGRKHVGPCEIDLPLDAITNLIGVLANQASAEYHAMGPSTDDAIPGYLLDENQKPICDITRPEQRAALAFETIQKIEAMEKEESSDYLKYHLPDKRYYVDDDEYYYNDLEEYE